MPLLAVAALTLAPAAARAQDKAAARELFDEGRALVQAGNYALACPKLEAASALYRGAGVLLNLGDCYEKAGRTASAWTALGEAAEAAVREGRVDVEAEAKRRRASIELRLSRLVIHVARPAEGLVVLRDERAVPPAAWDVAILVDPGTHVVQAEAPNRAPWSASIVVTDPGATIDVSVPELVESAPPAQAPREAASEMPSAGPPLGPQGLTISPPSSTPQVSAPSAFGTQRIFSLVLAGLGTASLATAGALSLESVSTYKAAQQDTGIARSTVSDEAVRTGNAATWFLGVGLSLVATGAILWFTAPGGAPAVGVSGSGVYVRGAL
jgi:hypothetical protein